MREKKRVSEKNHAFDITTRDPFNELSKVSSGLSQLK